MAENPHPEWMQAACQRCREGLPMRDGEVGCHVRAGQSEWVLRYPECTAPTPKRHIKDLTAKLDKANDVIRQIAQMFGITDVRHILGDLGRAQAANAVMRKALEEIQASPMTEWISRKATDALSHEAVAGEVEKRKDDPIRKALNTAIEMLSNCALAGCICRPTGMCSLHSFIATAREALNRRERVTFAIPEELAASLEAHCDSTGQTNNEVAESAIAACLEPKAPNGGA